MVTVTEITLNQINSALLSLKRDNENLYKLIFDLKTSNAELTDEVNELKRSLQENVQTTSEPEVTVQTDTEE